MTSPLLAASDLAKTYISKRGPFSSPTQVRAVDGVSLSLARGTTLGIVGESGSGKSTTGRLLLGLEPPTSGHVTFSGEPMPREKTPEWRSLRKRMQLVFQDPLAALDRRLPVGRQIGEPLDIHDVGSPDDRTARVRALMDAVGLRPDQADRYPHELSGGQRQRVVIARAIACGPDLLICDEPVSALDVSIQAQVVNLLRDLQERDAIAMVFISHDLKVVQNVSDRVAVMYLGRIIEEGAAEEIFRKPLHPYTQALVSSIPVPGMALKDRIILEGEPPNPAARPTGCAFHPRCRFTTARCKTDNPVFADAGGDRKVACHLLGPAVVTPRRAEAH